MKIQSLTTKVATWTICFALIAQNAVVAEVVTHRPSVQARDVALQANGALQGQIISQNGRPATKIPVTIQKNNVPVAQVVTDASGRFTANGLQGGVYQLVAHGTEATVRAWTANTAPPSAVDKVMINSGEAVVRGQDYFGPPPYSELPPPAPPARRFNPKLRRNLLIGAVIITAIAVPLALDDDDAS